MNRRRPARKKTGKPRNGHFQRKQRLKKIKHAAMPLNLSDSLKFKSRGRPFFNASNVHGIARKRISAFRSPKKVHFFRWVTCRSFKSLMVFPRSLSLYPSSTSSMDGAKNSAENPPTSMKSVLRTAPHPAQNVFASRLAF